MAAAVARIDALGITLRDIERGLIDFPALTSAAARCGCAGSSARRTSSTGTSSTPGSAGRRPLDRAAVTDDRARRRARAERRIVSRPTAAPRPTGRCPRADRDGGGHRRPAGLRRGRLLRGPRADGAGLDGHRRPGRARPHPGPDQARRGRGPRRAAAIPPAWHAISRARWSDSTRGACRTATRSPALVVDLERCSIAIDAAPAPSSPPTGDRPTRSPSRWSQPMNPAPADPDHRRRRGRATAARGPGTARSCVDVREPNEFEAVRAPGAVLVPMSAFAARAGELPADRPLMVVCHLGGRSAAAAGFLMRSGRERRRQRRAAAWTPGSVPACRSRTARPAPARATSRAAMPVRAQGGGAPAG